MTPEFKETLRKEIEKNFDRAAAYLGHAINELTEATHSIDMLYGSTENAESKNWRNYIQKLQNYAAGCEIMEKNYAKNEKI